MKDQLDPKRFPLLAKLPFPTVHRINEEVILQQYDKDAIVISKDSPATDFFFHVQGKALIEDTVDESFTVMLGTILPGYCYGWDALTPGERYHYSVVCSEECLIASITGERLMKILQEEPLVGLTFMLNLNNFLVDRLNLRTSQLVKVLGRHPDLAHA